VEDLVVYTMLARFKSASAEEYLEKALYYAKNAWILRARLLILPEAPHSFVLDESVLKSLSGELAEGYFAVLAGTSASGARKAFVVSNCEPAQEIGSIGLLSLPNESSIKIVRLSSAIRLGAMFDEEIHIPEIARTAMLQGADIIVHFDASTDDSTLKAIKTRSAENKIFIARSASAAREDCSSITNPDGARVTTTLRAEEHSAAAYVNTALSKFKSVVPGTDIVRGRSPDLYGRLFSS